MDMAAKVISRSRKILDQFYEGWQDTLQSFDAVTICIPTCLDVISGRLIKTRDENAKSRDKDFLKDAASNFDGDDGETKFLQCFQKLCIGGLLIGNFKSETCKAKLIGEKAEKKRKGGRPDFVFFHSKIGVVFFEVKGSRAENASQFKEGEIQLREMKDKYFPELLTLLPNKAGKIPGHYCLAGPLTSISLNRRRNNDNIFYLDKDEIETKETFRKILFDLYLKNLKDRLLGLSPEKADNLDLKNLEDRLLGLSLEKTDDLDLKNLEDRLLGLSLENLENNEPFKLESFFDFVAACCSTHSNCEVSHAYNALQIMTMIDSMKNLTGIVDNDLEFKALMSEKKKWPFLLNNEQLAALNYLFQKKDVDDSTKQPKHQIIIGPPGTGKTLIAVLQAIKAAKDRKQEKRKGIVVVCVGYKELIPKYEKMLTEKIPPAEFYVTDDKKMAESVDDLICDEMSMNDECIKMYKHRVTATGRTSICITGFHSPSEIVRAESDMEKHGLDVFLDNITRLKIVVRGTREIINTWKKDWPSKESYPNFDIQLGHHIQGVEPDLQASQGLLTVEAVLEQLVNKLKPYIKATKAIIKGTKAMGKAKNKEVKGKGQLQLKFEPQYIAVLTENEGSADYIVKYLQNRGINCGTVVEQMEDAGKVAVGHAITALSYDWPIVFVVSLTHMDHFEPFFLIAASRAIAVLTVIARDYILVQKKMDICKNPEKFLQKASLAENKIRRQEASLEENRIKYSINMMDYAFAIYRNNLLPKNLKKNIPYFADCNCFTDCIEKVLKKDILIIAIFNYLNKLFHQSLTVALRNLMKTSNVEKRPKLVDNLLENVVQEHEKRERWSCFERLFNKLLQPPPIISVQEKHEINDLEKRADWEHFCRVISIFTDSQRFLPDIRDTQWECDKLADSINSMKI